MSSASSESEQHESPTPKNKVLKSKKQRQACLGKDSDYEEETLAEKLSNLFSSSSNNEESDYSEEEDDFLEESECVKDFNLISAALEDTRIENKTFSDLELRDIERKNSILMNKILSHSRRPSQYKLAPSFNKISSSSINRKKQQQQIDRENLMLLKKIKTVKPFGLSNPKK